MSESLNNVGYYYRGMFIIGFLLLFVAAGDLALGIANAVVCGFLGSIGYGIWGSVLCLLAAVTGIVASKSQTTSWVVTHMVCAILAAVSATVQLAMSVNSAVIDHYFIHGRHYDTTKSESASQFRYFRFWACSERQRDSYQTEGSGPTVTDALLASFAIMQGLCAVIAAAFSCRAAFCPPGVDAMPWYTSRRRLVKIAI